MFRFFVSLKVVVNRLPNSVIYNRLPLCPNLILENHGQSISGGVLYRVLKTPADPGNYFLVHAYLGLIEQIRHDVAGQK